MIEVTVLREQLAAGAPAAEVLATARTLRETVAGSSAASATAAFMRLDALDALDRFIGELASQKAPAEEPAR